MKTMTPQEMFNRAYAGVIEQGGPSKGKNGMCVYRGIGGRKCAIGHLVDDDRLARVMESEGGVEAVIDAIDAPAFVAVGAREKLGFLMAEDGLAELMQKAHDMASGNKGGGFMGAFKASMANIAADYGLTVPKMEADQ